MLAKFSPVVLLAYLYSPPNASALGDNGYSHLAMENFSRTFNELSAGRNMQSRISRGSCLNGRYTTCTFEYNSVSLVLRAQADTNRVGYLVWICAKNCEGIDLTAGVVISLRILEPNRQPADYVNWGKLLNEDIVRVGAAKTTVGDTVISITANPTTGIMVTLGKSEKAQGE